MVRRVLHREEGMEPLSAERERWRRCRDDPNEERAREQDFRTMFPHGHRTSLRPFVRKLAQLVRLGDTVPWHGEPILADMHPRAYAFLARHGKSYTPKKWEYAPETEPMEGACYGNAWNVMRTCDAAYVEGIVAGVLARPMLHAWNAKDTRSAGAMDWSHYAGTHWSRYLGIAFTSDEYETLRHLAAHKGRLIIGLFHVDYFADLEPHMRGIVLSRR